MPHSNRSPVDFVSPFARNVLNAVVSDTQIKNPTLATSWTFDRLLFDLHLKKSWHFAMHFKPHHVIFLRDVTASGRGTVSDEECVPFI